MLRKLFVDQQKYLNAFFEQIDHDQAEKIYRILANCKGMLIFTGVGKSGTIAEKLANTMISTGTRALFLPPMNALHGDIGSIQKGDLFICLSKSGGTDELIHLVKAAKRKGAVTMAWISAKGSTLEKECDHTMYLPLERELCPFDLAPTTSTALQLIFGDILAVALMHEKSFTLDQYALNHPAGSIGKQISLKVADLMIQGSELPICAPSDTLSQVLVEFTNKRCGCILVVQNGVCQGIFTDGDLRRALQLHPNRIFNETMGHLMTSRFQSIHKDRLAQEALEVMQKDKRIMMLHVLEADRLIGLITMHDIVHAGLQTAKVSSGFD